MRLIAEIEKSSDGRLEGTIQCEHRDQPIPFSGTLELLRILEDEVPPAPAAGPSEPGHHGTHEL
jgi:hypothetical protein